jgi:hypothetical protein
LARRLKQQEETIKSKNGNKKGTSVKASVLNDTLTEDRSLH